MTYLANTLPDRPCLKNPSSSISLNVVDNKMEPELFGEDSNVDHDEELEKVDQ